MLKNFDMQRKILEKMYTGLCNVYEFKKIMNDTTKLISMKETAVLSLSDIPCKLSYIKIQPTEKKSGAAELAVSGKLFLSPDLQIKPGSKIEVRQEGRTEFYESSGKAAVYPTHQEIMLKQTERWA